MSDTRLKTNTQNVSLLSKLIIQICTLSFVTLRGWCHFFLIWPPPSRTCGKSQQFKVCMHLILLIWFYTFINKIFNSFVFPPYFSFDVYAFPSQFVQESEDPNQIYYSLLSNIKFEMVVSHALPLHSSIKKNENIEGSVTREKQIIITIDCS